MVQVQAPSNAVPGQIIQVAVPSVMPPVAMATPAQQPLSYVAPQQSKRTQGDAFNCAEAVVIKQEFNMIEVCGIEGKTTTESAKYGRSLYRKTDGQQLLLFRRNRVFERICCGPQRTLTFLPMLVTIKTLQHIYKCTSHFICKDCNRVADPNSMLTMAMVGQSAKLKILARVV